MPFLGPKRKKSSDLWFAVFILCFLSGIVIVYLNDQKLVWNSEFLEEGVFERIMRLTIDQNRLFCYSLQKRMKTAVFMFLMAAAGISGLCALSFWGWYGITAGTVLTVLSVRYGIRGIFLFFGCIMPQHLFLIPGYWGLLYICAKRAQKRELIMPVMILVLGCILEAYVNPWLLKLILRTFPI